MKRLVPISLAILAAAGCRHAEPPAKAAAAAQQQARPQPAAAANDSQTSPAQTQPAKAKSEPATLPLTADEIFKVLTAHTWNDRAPGAETRGLVDHTITTFRDDGTWSEKHVTDYEIPARTGTWNLQPAGSDWFVCRDDGMRQRVVLFDDGTISLRLGKLYPEQPRKRDSRRTAAKLPKLTLQPEVQQIVKRLTAHGWKRANDLDLRMEPTEVRFHPDWTYVATYRGGECTSRGTWYATVEEIFAHSPEGRCDDRPGRQGDQFRAEVIDERRILVSGDLYVPEDEPVIRGVIWHLFGYDNRTIRIEYDMPIRRGMPVQFDVTITNASNQTLTLDRFSLSREHSNYGRVGGDNGKELTLPGDELAGHDLERSPLQPGQSHSFTFTATFSEAGEQWWYFNALISGTTQNWDTHQAHELSVR